MAEESDADYTTLMFRRIPRRYDSWDVVRDLELHFVREEFDFVYVPSDQSGKKNMCLAFVNFCDSAVARRAVACMGGQAWTGAPNGGRIEMQPSNVQGLAESLRRFYQGSVRAAGQKSEPLVFKGGMLVPVDEALRTHGILSAADEEATDETTKFKAQWVVGCDIFEDITETIAQKRSSGVVLTAAASSLAAPSGTRPSVGATSPGTGASTMSVDGSQVSVPWNAAASDAETPVSHVPTMPTVVLSSENVWSL